MKRIIGLAIIASVFVVIYIALAVTHSPLLAAVVYLISFATAAIIMIGTSLAAGEDAFAVFRDLVDY